MSFSLLVRKLTAVGSLVVALPALVSGQSGFAPQGEYSIAGALPANQSRPGMGINADGGYIVWQDQNTFGNRLTLMGRALGGGLSSSQAPFRINSNAKGDHENPRVALLNNGGAVFVWQGGQAGFQHIFARFLSPSNSWLALDQLVNPSTKLFQGNPGVAVLANGNVVITYATYNTNTMQDVYGQMFSPAGVKIGNEFSINQFTAFNQRSPSVKALTNGGFVVAWVSEQQTKVAVESTVEVGVTQISRPSVDIYARLFDAGGVPVGGEFLVNAGSDIAAEPVIAAGADGGVMFVWSSFDAQLPNNGWDIVARPFTLSGVLPLAGTQARINTQLFGDQFNPQISVVGTNYMAIWTSLGQDGSRAGIYGQFLNANGSRSGEEIRVNTTTFGAQQQPALASDSSGRFLTAWTGPTYGSSGNDLFAQVYISSNFVAAALVNNYGSPTFVGETNAPPVVAGGGSGTYDPALEPPTLGYPGVISDGGSAIPAENAFAQAAGTYNGLFYSLNGISSASAGSFSAQLKLGKDKTTKEPTLTYTAKLTFSGTTHSISGQFGDFGDSPTKIIYRSGGKSPLVVSLQVDLFGAGQITGTIKAGNDWDASIYADRQVFNAKTSKSPFAGAYTLAIPGFANGPAGTGFGTIASSTSGGVTFTGTLADGTKISQKGAVSKTGVWPLFVPLSGGGVVISWIQIPTGSSANDLVWIKPTSGGNSLYPLGFTNGVTATVALNVPVGAGLRALNLSGGGLSQDKSYSIALGANGKASANGVTVAISSASGTFTGSVPHPVAGKPKIAIKGVIQGGGAGAGFFLGTGASGKVTLQQP